MALVIFVHFCSDPATEGMCRAGASAGKSSDAASSPWSLVMAGDDRDNGDISGSGHLSPP